MESDKTSETRVRDVAGESTQLVKNALPWE